MYENSFYLNPVVRASNHSFTRVEFSLRSVASNEEAIPCAEGLVGVLDEDDETLLRLADDYSRSVGLDGDMRFDFSVYRSGESYVAWQGVVVRHADLFGESLMLRQKLSHKDRV